MRSVSQFSNRTTIYMMHIDRMWKSGVLVLCGISLISAASLTKCPVTDNVDPIYYPHETDCHKFYQCSTGILHLLTCNADLYFNPKLNVCDRPYNVQCPQPTSTEEPTTQPEPTTTPNPTTKPEPTKSTTPTPEYLKCEADLDYLKPFPTDCSKYVSCEHGKGTLKDCPKGTNFDTDSASCIDKDAANCKFYLIPVIPDFNS